MDKSWRVLAQGRSPSLPLWSLLQVLSSTVPPPRRRPVMTKLGKNGLTKAQVVLEHLVIGTNLNQISPHPHRWLIT